VEWGSAEQGAGPRDASALGRSAEHGAYHRHRVPGDVRDLLVRLAGTLPILRERHGGALRIKDE